jgi:phosphoribosylanthranilate isomerase
LNRREELLGDIRTVANWVRIGEDGPISGGELRGGGRSLGWSRTPVMFRVKICGITTVDDARAVARSGADAVGLNFYAPSPRSVGLDRARQIVQALPTDVVKVGLFVNAPHGDICRTFDEAELNLIQLHGDEPPEFLTRLGDRPVMRAFRLGSAGLQPVADYLEECRQLGCLPRLILIDSSTEGAYGGTGRVADWTVVSRYPFRDWQPPLVLAGGLTPENVAQAIGTARPTAVDTASGVELSPGRKAEALVRQFVQAARNAFGSLS